MEKIKERRKWHSKKRTRKYKHDKHDFTKEFAVLKKQIMAEYQKDTKLWGKHGSTKQKIEKMYDRIGAVMRKRVESDSSMTPMVKRMYILEINIIIKELKYETEKTNFQKFFDQLKNNFKWEAKKENKRRGHTK